ncbi:hypothetical protein F5141DRAFT_1220785 [Pisolithus sp. B1]|nr:hypothetical protein F5141DRAFT_1220785 [Pisolithus sp. B1]
MSGSEEQPTDFKTEFHPRSHCPSLFQSQEEFGQYAFPAMVHDTQPWHPFIEEGDYMFAEIALQAGLSTSHINGLLMLISCIGQGKHAWDRAAMQVTLFAHHNVVTLYKGEDFTFPVYAQSLWEWVLDLLLNPLLAPHFTWDAQRLFKYNGSNYKRFYSEPWTGDHWWNIQIPESAKEEGKTGYNNYKHIIWHKVFYFILDNLAKLSKIGYKYECYDEITWWLFPLILILSTNGAQST